MSTLRANYITFYFLSSLGWEFSIQFFLEFGDVYHKTDSHVLVKHLLGNLIDLTLGLFKQEKKKNRENLWTKTGGNPCTHIIEVVKILKKWIYLGKMERIRHRQAWNDLHTSHSKGAYDTGGSHSAKISCIWQRIQTKRKWWEAQPQRIFSIWENLSLIGYTMRPSKLRFECTSCRGYL